MFWLYSKAGLQGGLEGLQALQHQDELRRPSRTLDHPFEVCWTLAIRPRDLRPFHPRMADLQLLEDRPRFEVC
jgi:hypothetical protein